MKRVSGFRFSPKAIFLWSFIALFLIGGIAAINSYSPAARAQGGGPTGGDMGTGGRMMGDASYERFSKPDQVTEVVRDRARGIYRVDIHSLADRANAEKAGTLVEDNGSFVIVSPANKASLTKFRLENTKLDTTVNLPGKSFEPILTPPAETLRSAENLGGPDYYVVQFGGTIKDEWMESLRSVGVEFLQYLPQNAYFIYADAEAVQKTLNHSRVRWVGSFTPEGKLPQVLLEKLSAARSRAPLRGGMTPLEMTGKNTAIFDVAVFARENADVMAANIANNYGGSVKHIIDLPNNYFNVVRVELPLDRVKEVANMTGVIRIDDYGTPKAEDEKSNQIVAGNYTSTTAINGPGYNPLTQFGVNGSGVTVSVVDDGVSMPGDGGFYVTSSMAVDGPLRGATAGATGHGHLNASIIAGTTPFSATLDPNGYNYGLGIAPAANIINIPFLKAGYSGTEANCYSDSLATNGPNGAPGFVSNNSWGNGTNSNVYDSYTAQFDGFVRDASAASSIDPIVLVFSAGNSGASGLTRPKTAKNLIAVASSENIRTNLDSGSNNIDDISSFSSRGLANDGRVKPDITAPGQAITGSRAGTDALFGNIDTFHRWSEGTSHAAPQVAGVAALYINQWRNAFATNPPPSWVKAIILNSGVEMGGVGATSPIPNGAEGWGRVNMKGIFGLNSTGISETVPFTNVGDAMVMRGAVVDPTKPLRITLVWTDPPAAAQPALVNNLDLTVTIGANTYKGNVFSGGLSTTGGTADSLNNVENVWIPAGLPFGTHVSITVSAAALNGDGILGNGDPTDQKFSMIATNFEGFFPEIASTVRSDFDGDRRSDVSVWRPSNGVWYTVRSSDSAFTADAWGMNGDVIVPGDYDGDGKVDLAVYRPSTQAWYVLKSGGGTIVASFGSPGDIPAAADYDQDGKTDLAVFRPSTGIWYIQGSDTGLLIFSFGTNGDLPVPGDYNGDGANDLGVFRPSTGDWWSLSLSGMKVTHFGQTGDRPAQGDYDGDGKTDLAVFRPSDGIWYILNSTSGFTATSFGINSDMPAPADFDGDQKDDIAVYRGSNGAWYEFCSFAGVRINNFGLNGDVPVPAGYIPQ